MGRYFGKVYKRPKGTFGACIDCAENKELPYCVIYSKGFNKEYMDLLKGRSGYSLCEDCAILRGI